MGIIALDIDGTVTDSSHKIPQRVETFLAKLSEDWQILFITGRTFPYGFQALEVCSFPFDYSVYNGAVTYKMPERTILRRHYLNPEVLVQLEALCKEEGVDYVLALGGDEREHCIYRLSRFSEEERKYLALREKVGGEPWESVDSFDGVAQTGLCYAKIFGTHEPLARIASQVEHAFTSLVHDPLREGGSVLMIGDPTANKGAALREYAQNDSGPVIAAGDDINDLTMLEVADIAVVMETAPPEVKQIADIIAPSADECGIIEGLTRALRAQPGSPS